MSLDSAARMFFVLLWLTALLLLAEPGAASGRAALGVTLVWAAPLLRDRIRGRRTARP
ncbi:hypothetical protein BJY16_005173 [Actinoplanes octamycinicus]|uniref:Uncharacterized protein n=1 Tax=Actinoplanes octamycinicus TaxID=135948 RepID=A0A7W7H0K3_9ACTN|nr:hypothetical protein [Actinoplanes octamycinicus]MBB4741714.1 hypothetical protein [Actinoplanes octamycinicus]GIE57267.1 hypothetical protein Aoc01nite_26690 [Actinoplanes octamycinicus]